ncbi:gp2-related protein [Trichomonas vaginalis G3]|uniref:receptor protein-tyrosine kinase n=1 Tax=Trichomonas vaginalis (strain ATCC PRA-98 / G3) TaxID=412133 RepID=A2E8G3_TRIV3|nr:glycine-rich protein family [Trichomonas vaginalis G3]EAY11091.1 gp2-related protein [Trichomonas vaginalis G3]KAI5520449.1 glycine-rich protein family [Trichomonas vaginalis G3]|eukprot:XP_001323314.1 gp2-related protein [Trichomonas vaginalis G3]
MLDVWGAQGCNVTNGVRGPLIPGGTGGHSAGVFVAVAETMLYLHLGGTSNTTQSFLATYNGGATGVNDADGCGGGASDFRTKKSAWNENLNSRIIISGGGGGAYGRYGLYYGGKGGGQKGETDSSGMAAVGTQYGCEGPEYSQCGTLGAGKGDWFAKSDICKVSNLTLCKGSKLSDSASAPK